MSGDGFHPPLEEYLEAIHELEEEGSALIQARLAERVGHSAPSVSEMVRRLKTEGWIEANARDLRLTKKGRAKAESVVRKHRLAERLLCDVIGLDWHKTHLEACRWEHVISDEVEERLVALLGNPSTCPHGNPIPGVPQDTEDVTPLAAALVGDVVVLRRVTEEIEVDLQTLTYLHEHAFKPGTTATVKDKAPDGTLMLSLDDHTLAVGPALAACLFVAAG